MASQAQRALNVLDSVEPTVAPRPPAPTASRDSHSSDAAPPRLSQSAFVLVLACLAFHSLLAVATLHALVAAQLAPSLLPSGEGAPAVRAFLSDHRELAPAEASLDGPGDATTVCELGLVETEEPEEDAQLYGVVTQPPVHLPRVALAAGETRGTASRAWLPESLGSAALPRGPPLHF